VQAAAWVVYISDSDENAVDMYADKGHPAINPDGESPFITDFDNGSLLIQARAGWTTCLAVRTGAVPAKLVCAFHIGALPTHTRRNPHPDAFACTSVAKGGLSD
jgi:hypothetical protein